jgi:transposase
VAMRPPTPPQLRTVIVRLREEGRTYQQIADTVDLGVATVNRILRLHRKTGTTAPLKPGGGNLSPIRGRVELKLRALVAAMPDSTVAELGEALSQAEKLATSRASVQRALTRMGYSRKKRNSSR